MDYYGGNERIRLPDGSLCSGEDVFGWYGVAKEYVERYRRPIMHTETNAGADRAPEWLWKQWLNILRMRADGVPVLGFTWYSLGDQLDWDTLLTEKNGRVSPCGLYDLDRKPRAVAEAYRSLLRGVREDHDPPPRRALHPHRPPRAAQGGGVESPVAPHAGEPHPPSGGTHDHEAPARPPRPRRRRRARRLRLREGRGAGRVRRSRQRRGRAGRLRERLRHRARDAPGRAEGRHDRRRRDRDQPAPRRRLGDLRPARKARRPRGLQHLRPRGRERREPPEPLRRARDRARLPGPGR